jgi:ribosomal protein L37AE/L43A
MQFFETRNVHVPHCPSFNTNDSLRANVHERGTCPACGSKVWIFTTETTRECADCGNTYRGPHVTAKQLAAQEKADA